MQACPFQNAMLQLSLVVQRSGRGGICVSFKKLYREILAANTPSSGGRATCVVVYAGTTKTNLKFWAPQLLEDRAQNSRSVLAIPVQILHKSGSAPKVGVCALGGS